MVGDGLAVSSCEAVKADDGSRTRDLRLGKPTLYQLSYVRAASDSKGRAALLSDTSGHGRAAAARGSICCGARRQPVLTSARSIELAIVWNFTSGGPTIVAEIACRNSLT